MKFSMVTDSEQNITFNVFLVPNNKEKSDMTTTLYFDFLSTGIVDKVI